MQIIKKNINVDQLQAYKGKVNDALDYLWKEEWLNAAITKADRADLSFIQELAQAIQAQSDLLLVLAEGTAAKTVEALTDALPANEGFPEVIVFGETFSTKDYTALFDALQDRDFSILAVSEGEESLALRGAYVCLKRHLVGKYGAAKAVERMYVIVGKESQLIAKDAAENEIAMLTYPADVKSGCLANTNLAKLILAVKGASVEAYLDGFYEVLASPMWDLDGTDYAVAQVMHQKSDGDGEQLLIWQRELESFGRLQERLCPGLEKETLYLPKEIHRVKAKAFTTQLMFAHGEDDLMMPYFEGCHPDGSLNLLLGDVAEKYFLENNQQRPQVEICFDALNSNTLGKLFAFFQLSCGISEFLLNN